MSTQPSKPSPRTGHLLPEHRPPTHPGEMLREEFLLPLNISQAELARRLGKTATAINELVKGKRGVSAEMAILLSEELKTTAELWLKLQMSWDLWHAKRSLAARRR